MPVDLICRLADRTSSIQHIRRRWVPGGSQDFFGDLGLTSDAGTLGNPRPIVDC
ncbi:MAG TPA: hypothetical protein VGY55_11235 [Pirellulales bacterium]|jgi:hypothetical protein|nr:hypothetical protein [Pirellulales bacterium]